MIEKLIGRGLKVSPTDPKGPYGNGYYVNKDEDKDDEDDEVRLFIGKDGKWIVEHWNYIPGPSETDFISSFETFELAINAALNYYFGKPVVVNDWIFYLHRHPEIDLAKLHIVLSENLVKVTIKEFALIKKERFNEADEKYVSRWDIALESQFLEIHHVSNKNVILFLRRDLQEGFILSK